jgi:hypothetical protein
MESTETELLRQRLADAEAKVDELMTEVDNLTSELARFRAIGLVPVGWCYDLPTVIFHGEIPTQMAYTQDDE